GSKPELEARKAGRAVLAELRVDLDGDRKDEIAIVEQGPKLATKVVVLKVGGEEDAPSFTPIASSSPRTAQKIARFEIKRLIGSARAPQILAVLEERSPDETVQHVRILGPTPRGIGELFAQSFFVPTAEPADGIEVVEFGDAAPRLSVLDVDGPSG